ncbi:hypothetical protein D9757_006404 [Collybiopsis confluens]|uniref:Uncharacterized protein n=1 Tax=Collybiopsis confluens TaxID=2823264 RepID=A0A8H5M7W8_9AGAR|nr:hypothetical protein D9757_006404 [Collybiopsis confluens]
MYPKIVALDTDWTLFWGWLKVNEWGRGPNAYVPQQDNIEKRNYWEVEDRTNRSIACGMYADIPKIIKDILKNGAKLAIVSRNTSRDMCDRALWHWTVQDQHGKDKRLIKLVTFDEVYNTHAEDKTEHFRAIKGYSKVDYSDMILYDDEAFNNTVEMMLGVTFQVSRDQKGLTWDNYQEGLDIWRRTKAIYSPYHGLGLGHYPKGKLIGYSGMDMRSIQELEAGGRRSDRKEAARWGFAVYVADDPRVAIYFKKWIKQFFPGSQTVVCAIYARDGEIWDRMNKIWAPNSRGDIQQNRSSEFKLGWSEEDRNRQVAQWGVKKPYVLFSRHPEMAGSNIRGRFTELVIYPQVQENLLLMFRMSDNELNTARNINYAGRIREWNITIPQQTRDDFRNFGENIG